MVKKKNKKGLLFMVLAPIYLVLIIVLLILLIWFGFKISGVVNAVVGFFQAYWKWLLIGLGVIIFHKQVGAILNFILGKIGVKVK